MRARGAGGRGRRRSALHLRWCDEGRETGGAHTCALVHGGVQCWGDSSYGATGNGNLPNAIEISSGYEFSCGVTDNLLVQCFGDYAYYALGWGGNGVTEGMSAAILGSSPGWNMWAPASFKAAPNAIHQFTNSRIHQFTNSPIISYLPLSF